MIVLLQESHVTRWIYHVVQDINVLLVHFPLNHSQPIDAFQIKLLVRNARLNKLRIHENFDFFVVGSYLWKRIILLIDSLFFVRWNMHLKICFTVDEINHYHHFLSPRTKMVLGVFWISFERSASGVPHWNSQFCRRRFKSSKKTWNYPSKILVVCHRLWFEN